MAGRSERIHDHMVASFAPSVLEVIDESYAHSVPEDAESHFKVVVVSESFAGTATLARHRSVNAVLAAEFRAGLHALSIAAYTPEQWAERGGVIPSSPPCMGGSKVG